MIVQSRMPHYAKKVPGQLLKSVVKMSVPQEAADGPQKTTSITR